MIGNLPFKVSDVPRPGAGAYGENRPVSAIRTNKNGDPKDAIKM
jgi:hypothetical protein